MKYIPLLIILLCSCQTEIHRHIYSEDGQTYTIMTISTENDTSYSQPYITPLSLVPRIDSLGQRIDDTDKRLAELAGRVSQLECIDSVVTFIWNKNPEPDVAYYTLYIENPRIVTGDTSITIDLRRIGTVTATDYSGNQSDRSNEVRIK